MTDYPVAYGRLHHVSGVDLVTGICVVYSRRERCMDVVLSTPPVGKRVGDPNTQAHLLIHDADTAERVAAELIEAARQHREAKAKGA